MNGNLPFDVHPAIFDFLTGYDFTCDLQSPPDCHAHNAMVVLQGMIDEFPSNIADRIENFIGTVPWWWTNFMFENAAADPQKEQTNEYRVRLFAAPAGQWGAPMEDWGRPSPLRLLMTVDGPFAPRDTNILVWGERVVDFFFDMPQHPRRFIYLMDLARVFDFHMREVEQLEQEFDQWEDNQGFDGWTLAHPWEVVFEHQQLPTPDDLEQEPTVQGVGIEQCNDEHLSFVGLRPTGFNKPLLFQSTKGQAARAAREILRHTILHCQTNLSAVVRNNNGWLAKGTKEDADQPHEFLTIAPDPYLAWQEVPAVGDLVDLFDAADEFSRDLSTWEDQYIVLQSGDCDGLNPSLGPCTLELIPQGRSLAIPVIWPAGFDNQVLVHQGKDADFSPGIYKPLKLWVSHDQELGDQQPAGQFFPGLGQYFTTPVGCVLAYQLVVKYWLPFGSLQVDNYMEGEHDQDTGEQEGHWEGLEDMIAKLNHPKNEPIPNADGSPGSDQGFQYAPLAIERFALAEQTNWLWDSELVVPVAEFGNPGWNKPFVGDETENLWKKLNCIPDQYPNCLAWNMNGPERHQRLILTLIKTENPTTATVVPNNGDAAVCFKFQQAAGNPSPLGTQYPYFCDNAGNPGLQHIDGQEHSRFSPFSWPWRDDDTEFYHFASPFWDAPECHILHGCYPGDQGEFLAEDIQGILTQDDVPNPDALPAGWLGYSGFAFPPGNLP